MQTIAFSAPIPPSVNNAYLTTRRYGKTWTDESRKWIIAAGAIARAAARNQGWEYSVNEKLILELWAFWPDNRRRDIHNLHKILADALEGVIYADDSKLLIRDMDFDIDRKNPRIECVFYRFDLVIRVGEANV